MQDGKTPLMYAAQRNNIQAAWILISHGADLKAAAVVSWTTSFMTEKDFIATQQFILNVQMCIAPYNYATSPEMQCILRFDDINQ